MVIRGPLGVGKSTVSEQLARRIGAEHVAIDRILEEHGLEEWDEDRISLRSFLRANEIAAKRARGFVENATPVVLDGNFYWREAIEDLLDRLRFPHYVFTLEAPLGVCIARDAERPPTRAGAEPRAGDRLGEAAATQVYRLTSQVRYGVAVDATGPLENAVSEILRRLPRAASV